MQLLYPEVINWKTYDYPHILPFIGVTGDAFDGSICLLSPWMENGSLLRYLSNKQTAGRLAGQDLIKTMNARVCNLSIVEYVVVHD